MTKLQVIKDLRAYSKEPTTHEDFIVKDSRKLIGDPLTDFTICYCKTKVIVRDFPSITFAYTVRPLKSGVREVFERVDWSKFSSGTTNSNNILFCDVVAAYEAYK